MYKILPILLFGILIAEEDYFPKHKLDSLRNILRIENENNSSQSFIDSIRYTGMFKPDEIAFDSLYILYPEIVARGWMNYEEHYQYKKILLVEEIESRLNSMSDNKLILFNVTFEIIDSIDCNTKEVCVNDHYSLIVEDEYGDSLYWGKLIKEDVEDDNNAQGLHIFTIREQTPLRMRGIYYYNPKDYEYKIITGKINIEGIHDYRMDKSLKAGFVKIINSTHPSLLHCEDCISFTSVDMDSLRGINKKIKSNIFLTRNDIYDNSWAVIIGIDNYENLSNLDYAVADAEAVKDMIINKFDYPKENVNLLLNAEANKTNIEQAISDVSLKAGENDRILVFYAGHGETMPLPDGGEMGYLLPIDGRLENLYASAIPMNDLKDLSNMSKAKHMLFLVDACYGGLAAVGSRGLEPAKTPNYIEKITKIKSRQIITAGGKDEKVFEKSEWGHSAYTKNLLSALEGGFADSNEDGYITADELGDYLSEKVSIDSENQQTPQSRRLTSHEGEFIFLHSENTVAIQDKSADKKLDYLISEIEELKLQKSSGDDIVVEKAANGKSSFYKNFEYERTGLTFALFQDIIAVGYLKNINKNWRFNIGYNHIGTKSFKRLIPIREFHSLTSHAFALLINYEYYFTDRVVTFSGGGTVYNLFSWEHENQNTSGKTSLLFPVLDAGIAVFPFQFFDKHMDLGFSTGLMALYIPTLYEVDAEDIVIMKDWKMVFSPIVSLQLEFTKK